MGHDSLYALRVFEEVFRGAPVGDLRHVPAVRDRSEQYAFRFQIEIGYPLTVGVTDGFRRRNSGPESLVERQLSGTVAEVASIQYSIAIHASGWLP